MKFSFCKAAFKATALFAGSLLLCVFVNAQVAINTMGSLPDTSAMLDVSSSSRGVLFPRMSNAERNAIVLPKAGLQIYNTTTNALNVYNGTSWQQTQYWQDTATILVRAVSDLPAASGGVITLDSNKVYVFSGVVNVSPNYINLNGAAVLGRGLHDGVTSTVTGAVLRSTNKTVYVEKICIVPRSSATRAYDFSDATGTRTCYLAAGNTVIDSVGASLGVGQVSGFKDIIVTDCAWLTADGLKVTGNATRLAVISCLVINMTGTAIEFLSGMTVTDVIINSCSFNTVGTGVKVAATANVGAGKMTSNVLRSVTTPLSGITSFTPGWEMMQNTNIVNSRSYGNIYMNDNATSTTFSNSNTYVKVAGTTTLTVGQKFSASNNRLTYTGKRDLTSARVFIAITGKSPNFLTSGSFTFAVAKNGTILSGPKANTGSMGGNQAFFLSQEIEVDLSTNDYIEVFVKNNSSTLSLPISDFQLRVVE